MATPTELIQQLYVAYYNRPADVAGLTFYVNAYNNGASIAEISKAFNGAAEYTAAYAGKSADAIVNTVYQNLFGRGADSEGLDFWGKKIAAKEITVADLVKFITAGALNADGTPNADGLVFNNKVAAAIAFTTEIGTAGNEAERVAYSSGSADVLTIAKSFIAGVTTDVSLAAAQANVHATAQSILPVPETATPKSFTLSANVDTGAAFLGGAGDDIYNATGSTLTALDSIDGGAGKNTLSIQDPAASLATTLPAGVSLKNIQTITVNTAGSLGQVTAAGSAAVPAVKQVLTITPSAVVGTSTSTITVSYGGVSVTTSALAGGGTVVASDVAALITSAINAIAGSTVATTVGSQVVVTAPVAGVALPTIVTTLSTPADATLTQATPQPNVAAQAAVAATSAAVYDVTGVTSLTTLGVNSIGNDNIKAAATTDVTLTNTANTNTTTVVGGKAVTITENGTAGAVVVDGTAGALVVNQNTTGAVTIGGTTAVAGTVAVTAAAQGATAIAIDGGTAVNVTTAGVSTGTITIGNTTKATGAIAVDSTSAYRASTGADFTLGNVVVKGGTTVAVTQHAASAAANTAAAADATNFTVTQAAVAVTGGANTTAVTVTNDAIATVHNQSDAVAVATESHTVTFTALAATQSVTINGLTFTAGSAGTTIAQTAAAFANLTAGALQGNSTLGVYTGAFNALGYTSGAVSGATSNTVVFTGAAAGAIAGNIAVAGTGVVLASSVQGVDAVDAVVGNAGVVANTIAITDANFAGGTALGKITTATLSNFTTATISDTALSTLNVTGGSSDITIINSGLTNPTVKTLALNIAGQTAGTLDDADIYTTLNVTTSTTKSTLANITFGGATALNVSGTKGLTLTSAAGLTSLATVTVSGAAGLSATLTQATVTDVNASATSGANTITIDATKATYEGGTGVDSVTTSAVAPTKAITLGAGADKLTLASGTTSVTGLINGGADIDTLSMVAADAVTASANSLFSTKVTNFETLQLTGGTGAQLVHVDTLGGYNSVISGGGAGTLTMDGFTSGGTLTLTSNSAGSYVVSSSGWTTPTNDTFNIALSSAASLTGGTVTADKVESLVLTSTDTDLTSVNTNTLTVAGDTATSITVSGNAALQLTSSAALVTTVNASALTAGLTYTASGTAAQTVTGSATAANALSAQAGTTADRLIGGSAADTLTANAGADTLTGGAGRDKFVVATASSNVNVYSTITDASSGDSIQLASVGTETFTTTKLSLGDTATFQNYVDLAAAGATGAGNAAIKWFQYAGNTYIVEDMSNSTSFAAGTDIVVKLTGLVDLSTASLNNASVPVLLIG